MLLGRLIRRRNVRNHLFPVPRLHVLDALAAHVVGDEVRDDAQQGHNVARLGQHDVAAAARQDLLDDALGHGLDLEAGEHEVVVLVEAVEQRRLGVRRVHGDGAHAGRVVDRLELGRQALVEGHRRRLGGAVVDDERGREPRRLRGNGDNHAVVAADHARQERLGDPVVRQRVDVKGEAHVGGLGVHDGLAAGDAGVVDEHRRVADLAPDLVGHLVDGGGRAEVALEVVYPGCCRVLLVRGARRIH